jgi:hypothetical protein
MTKSLEHHLFEITVIHQMTLDVLPEPIVSALERVTSNVNRTLHVAPTIKVKISVLKLIQNSKNDQLDLC